ncbi:MAG TPA: cyclophilin-like fold protein [Methanothrix sp.]|nr:cyclophilin-like fold protein [Methanothrix sp.]
MRMIEIEIVGKGKALAKLDERNPGIREAFFRALPMEGRASLWGEEVYFDVPLQMKDENPSPIAASGDVCYWSPGPAFCIFFGKTQPYSAVNHIGKISEGLEIFRRAEAGDRIIIRRR